MPVGFAKLIRLAIENLFIDGLFQRLNPVEFIIKFAEFNYFFNRDPQKDDAHKSQQCDCNYLIIGEAFFLVRVHQIKIPTHR